MCCSRSQPSSRTGLRRSWRTCCPVRVHSTPPLDFSPSRMETKTVWHKVSFLVWWTWGRSLHMPPPCIGGRRKGMETQKMPIRFETVCTRMVCHPLRFPIRERLSDIHFRPLRLRPSRRNDVYFSLCWRYRPICCAYHHIQQPRPIPQVWIWAHRPLYGIVTSRPVNHLQ